MIKIVGHNIKGFDLPYLHKADLQIVSQGHPFKSVRGYWDDIFFDTMLEWDPQGRISLDRLASLLGCEFGKNGNGKHFHAMSQDDKESYLANDLKMIEWVWERENKNCRYADNAIIFDIETAPKSREQLEQIVPPFDRDTVEVPKNYKKQETIDAYLDDKEENYWPSIMDKAALDPTLSDVVAIGYIIDGKVDLHFDKPAELINRFWDVCMQAWSQNIKTKYK